MEESLKLIVLADDPLARAGLTALVSSIRGFDVIAQGGSDALLDAAGGALEQSADLILWDTGWEMSEQLFEEELGQSVPVIALVADHENAGIAWRLGCRGVLTRELDDLRLTAAMSAVAAGLAVLSPTVTVLLEDSKDHRDATATELTPREAEVLSLVAEGLTNKAIAQRLAISDHTVKFHVNAILSKLDAQSRTDAVVRATRLGLIAL